MNENDKIYTAPQEAAAEHNGFDATAQTSAQPTVTEVQEQSVTPEQPIATPTQPVQPQGTPAPQQPYTQGFAPQQGYIPQPVVNSAPTTPPNGAYYQPQSPVQGRYVPYGAQPGYVPQQSVPQTNVPPQGTPAPYGVPQYAPPQGQYVPPAPPQYQNPYGTPAGQPYYNNPNPGNVPPQYGYIPTYNQPATGNFSPVMGGAQYTPAQAPVSNRPIVQPTPVKQIDPETKQRKADVKRLANASTVPLLVYQVGGSLLVLLISSLITAFFGEVKGAQILSDPDFSYLINGFFSILFMSVPLLITAAWTKQPLSQTVAIRRFKPSTGIAIIMLGFGAIAIAQYSGAMVTQYLSQIFGEPIKNPTSDFGTEPWSIFINLFCIGIIPAFMEEFAFRGVLLGTARKYVSNGLAIMLNAILFSLLHGNLFQIPFTFALGLFLAYATVYTGSLWPAIIIHGVNNCLAVLMSYAQDAATSDLMQAVLAGAYYLVLLLVGLCGLIFLIKATGQEPTFKISNERSEHTKQNFGWFISAPWMIVFVVFMILNVIVTQLAG